jgi:hypothetical protein
MKGFLLGLLCAAIAVGVYWHWFHPPLPVAPVASVDAGATAEPAKRKKRRRGASRVAKVDPDLDHEPVRLSAADLKPVAQGDNLSTPDVLRLDMSNDKELTELSQDQIDDYFRRKEGAIMECIANARPDPETYVPGKVTVKFRIQRAGTVRGVRVEAPAILMRGGLHACLKGVVMGIRFPASQTSQIVGYPFTLN